MVNNSSKVAKIREFVQEYSFTTLAISTPSATSACIATKQDDACQRGSQETGAPRMQSAGDKACVSSLQQCRPTARALTFSHCQAMPFHYPCTKQT